MGGILEAIDYAKALGGCKMSWDIELQRQKTNYRCLEILFNPKKGLNLNREKLKLALKNSELGYSNPKE